MSYIEVGATHAGADFQTKKLLKAAIASDPAKVRFYGVSPFSPFTGTAADTVIGDKYTVTGPNPYTSRKWWATVEKLANGKIRVS